MGILDKLKEGIDTLKNASNKSVTDYEKEGGPKLPKKAVVVKKTTIMAEPEDDLPAMNDKGEYLKPRPYKKGGAVKTKCMARGGGCEVRGKTKGRFV